MMTITAANLKNACEYLAYANNQSVLDAISLVQTGAAIAGDEYLLEMLSVLKRDFIPGYYDADLPEDI